MDDYKLDLIRRINKAWRDGKECLEETCIGFDGSVFDAGCDLDFARIRFAKRLVETAKDNDIKRHHLNKNLLTWSEEGNI